MIDAIFAGNYDLAIKRMGNVEIVVNEILETNKQPMEAIQVKIKKPISDILSSEEYPEEKRLLQMVYVAASHHYSNKGYPSHEDMGGVLPDYKTWFKSSGEDQAIILAILDVNDALRSERSYKEPKDPLFTERVLVKDFLSKEGSEKYKKILEFIFNCWEKMQGADEYTAKRKRNDG